MPDGHTPIERILTVARQTIAQVRYCWAVTSGADGVPSARVVEPFDHPGDSDWMIWFLTSASSRKTAQIRQRPRITLGYQYDTEFAYVTLIGAALIVTDRVQLNQHWRDAWSAFFPLGPSDPDAVFVATTIERIELWNPVRSVAPSPYGLRSAVIEKNSVGHWELLYG